MQKHALIAIMSVSISLLAGAALAQDQPGRRNRGQRPADNGLKVGQLAPTFKLASIDGKDKFDLKIYREKKPVILFYGSYT